MGQVINNVHSYYTAYEVEQTIGNDQGPYSWYLYKQDYRNPSPFISQSKELAHLVKYRFANTEGLSDEDFWKYKFRRPIAKAAGQSTTVLGENVDNLDPLERMKDPSPYTTGDNWADGVNFLDYFNGIRHQPRTNTIFKSLAKDSVEFPFVKLNGSRPANTDRIWMAQYDLPSFNHLCFVYDSQAVKQYYGNILNRDFTNCLTRIELCMDDAGSYLNASDDGGSGTLVKFCFMFTTHTNFDPQSLQEVDTNRQNQSYEMYSINGTKFGTNIQTTTQQGDGYFYRVEGPEKWELAPLAQKRISFIVNYLDPSYANKHECVSFRIAGDGATTKTDVDDIGGYTLLEDGNKILYEDNDTMINNATWGYTKRYHQIWKPYYCDNSEQIILEDGEGIEQEEATYTYERSLVKKGVFLQEDNDSRSFLTNSGFGGIALEEDVTPYTNAAIKQNHLNIIVHNNLNDTQIATYTQAVSNSAISKRNLILLENGTERDICGQT